MSRKHRKVVAMLAGVAEADDYTKCHFIAWQEFNNVPWFLSSCPLMMAG